MFERKSYATEKRGKAINKSLHKPKVSKKDIGILFDFIFSF
jgi:hypothetical protein